MSMTTKFENEMEKQQQNLTLKTIRTNKIAHLTKQ